MKIPVIKLMVEKYNLHQLQDAEVCLMEDEPLKIDVDGEDEGEQLTHIIAAIYIKEMMERDKVDFKTALRDYTSRVRQSIS